MENHLLQIPSPILKIMLVRTSIKTNVLIKTGILLLLPTSFLYDHILCNIVLSKKSYSTISILDVTFNMISKMPPMNLIKDPILQGPRHFHHKEKCISNFRITKFSANQCTIARRHKVSRRIVIDQSR